MPEFNHFLKILEDIRRRVNSFKNLEPEDIIIQYEKIYPEFEQVKSEITAEAKRKIMDSGELSTSDLLQLFTVMQLQTDTKIELCFSLIKTLRKGK